MHRLKYNLKLIFLCTIIGYSINIDATLSDMVCEKAKQAYVVTCKKTRALYATIKEHKKLIAGLSVYVAFELVGYSHGWDTPLQRLLTPKKILDNTQVPDDRHAAQIAQLNRAHQQELEEQRQAYQELQQRSEEFQREIEQLTRDYEQELREERRIYQESQQRCEDLQKQVRALHQELYVELTAKLKREQKLREIGAEVTAMKEKDIALLEKWKNLDNK